MTGSDPFRISNVDLAAIECYNKPKVLTHSANCRVNPTEIDNQLYIWLEPDRAQRALFDCLHICDRVESSLLKWERKTP